jgi:metal-dependent hydrolase (beta-lactamase superfamily II)
MGFLSCLRPAGGDAQTPIFDAGPEAYTVTRNGALLRIPFRDAGAVLSHGYWDHAGRHVKSW